MREENKNRLELREQYTSETTGKNYNKKDNILNSIISTLVVLLIAIIVAMIVYAISCCTKVNIIYLAISFISGLYKILKEILTILFLFFGFRYFKNRK